MSQLAHRFYIDLLGAPFVEGARGPFAFDCVGLAAEVQRRIGRDLPEFVSNVEELHRQILPGGLLDDCNKVETPDAGCVGLVRMVGQQFHIVTFVDPHRILHTSRQTNSAVVERALSPLWTRRFLGFYEMGRPR